MESLLRKHDSEDSPLMEVSPPAKRICLPSIEEGARQPRDFDSLVAVATEKLVSKQSGADWGRTSSIPAITTSLSSLPDNQELICYGALFDVKAAINLPNGIAHCSDLIQKPGPTQNYHIDIHDSKRYTLSDLGGEFAVIDSTTATFLCALENIPNIHLLAVVESAKLKQAKRSQKRSCIIPLSINIYGRYETGEDIGDTLGGIGAFLQHPLFLETGIEYYNPQFYYPDGKLESLTHLVGLSDSDIAASILSEEVESVLASLDNHGTGVIESVADLSHITSELQRHQKLALSFMRRQEDSNELQIIRRDLFRVVGLPRSDRIPLSCTGGILADVMGLGKTLSMLALISSSLHHALNYQSCIDVAPQERCDIVGIRTRASLIVVTSAQLLDSWLTEIHKHLQPKALKVLVFHGDKRPRLRELIADHDIVLTTYSTLVADCRSAKMLQSLTWFRVVLDEAHWIRNQASQQFKALTKVYSQHRWCMTGTPIQNGINDLLSLLRFLQLEPLCNKATFQKHILEPLSRGTTERTKPLHVLLRGLCLRRDETHLNLPIPIYQTVDISFESKERELYQNVLNTCQNDLDDVVSGQSKSKKYAVLFAAIMRLRRLCNHGTKQSIEGASSSTPNTSCLWDLSCEYCRENQEENLAALNRETMCPECGRELLLVQKPEILTPEHDRSRNSRPGDFMEMDQDYNWLPIDEATHIGSSSKLTRVVDNLAQNSNDGKSLVFSFWTSTLDLLKQMLTKQNIPCSVIDGRVPYTERPRILEQFRQDDKIRILLMTIQTGAVGLNLTAANFVHIIEPQWNPSIEEQAIGRALRMGQTRTVTVFRYVIQSSIEQNIQTLQKKKRNLAKFTLDGSGTESGSLEDFQFMLDM